MYKFYKKPFGILLLILLTLYTIHKSILTFTLLKFEAAIFEFSLEKLYLLFSIMTIIIILILIKVKQKSLDNVGMTFLLITSIKMIIYYVIGRSIINQVNSENQLEKWNYFAMFIIFLLIETVFTIYLLNAENDKKMK
ncbi:hypothetical protein [Flavobacterium sp.]|uniref:hypothetical protein n=1 Tax=Flavobacterium sp. TaxID=239 RepID=UPI00286D26D9|nr:hypothetical protein [Flavobacterium sp.]